MRLELRWGLAATAALALGVGCAEPYARLAAPCYALAAELLARGHPWEIDRIVVAPGRTRFTAELQLHGYVRRSMSSPDHAARVVGRVQVGEVVETPLVFWTLLLGWPAATLRQRAWRLAGGIPMFLCLEALTTGTQLMLPLAQASAILADDPDPVTPWDHWSRFLESGGQFVLDCAAAALIAAAPGRHTRRTAAGMQQN
jgi:hypothetical protein